MRRFALLLSSALMLAACGDIGAHPDAAPPGSEPQPEPPPGPVGPPVGPAVVAPVFAGDWATTPENCGRYAWTVAADQLDTPGEVFCRWVPGEIRASGPARWTVAATCSGEADASPTTLTFIGGDQTLTIEGAPFDPVPLSRCVPAAPAN